VKGVLLRNPNVVVKNRESDCKLQKPLERATFPPIRDYSRKIFVKVTGGGLVTIKRGKK